jgi:hypothetical protein
MRTLGGHRELYGGPSGSPKMRLFPLAILAVLSACNQQDRENRSDSLTTTIPLSEDNSAGNESNAPDISEKGYGGESGASSSTSSSPSPATVTSSGTLPIAFRGFWTGLDDDCGNARSDKRLMVGPKELRFYESVGKVTAVEQAGPLAVIVDADFEGEGQSWSRQQKLTLSADQNRLTIANQVLRKRCSAGS